MTTNRFLLNIFSYYNGDKLFTYLKYFVVVLILSHNLNAEEPDSLLITSAEVELTNWEMLPLVSYDTDYGLGYGLKFFFLNQFGYKESIDLVAYSATKGMKWFRVVLSVPDFELRQNTEYPFAYDLIADFTNTNSIFYGLGNSSSFDNREEYNTEPLDIRLQFSRGITPVVVAGGGLRYNSTTNYNVKQNGLIEALGRISSTTSRFAGVFIFIRYDSRNSFINPSRGTVLEGEYEYVPVISLNNVNFHSYSAAARYYHKVFDPSVIFAVRITLKGKAGSNIPLQNLTSFGGGPSLRGYTINRLVDKYGSLINTEIRFPLVWKFSGIAGIDAANVWGRLSDVSLSNWKVSPAAGLRFHFETFIVRIDMGFSKETTGFYLDFGHIF
jgi:outer membrane protein assembly factor BamA